MRLTHIRLLVTDFDACFRFYRDMMGLEVAWGAEGEGYADFKAGEGVALALFGRKDQGLTQAVGTTNLPTDAAGQDRAALIFDLDDLDAKVAELKSLGAAIVTEPQDRPDWGIRTAHLRDPDGNLIELISPMPHAEWSEELKEEAARYGDAAG